MLQKIGESLGISFRFFALSFLLLAVLFVLQLVELSAVLGVPLLVGLLIFTGVLAIKWFSSSS
jgi:UPF0716 family protein affecting phage T7 exclusion